MNQQPLTNAQKILALGDLQSSDGWRAVLEEIDREIRKIETALVETAKPEDVEALRAEREHWFRLKEIPVRVADNLKSVTPGYDPGY